MSNNVLFSVGHSTQEQEEFLGLLRPFGVNCVIDVRSVPASARAPQFNQEPLSFFLGENKISYLHFGKEFGARRTDCLDENGRVDFEKAVKTDAFLHGVERVKSGLKKGFKIAFMCTESDPVACHRFSLVSRFFHDSGFSVLHILKDGYAISHKKLEDRVLAEMEDKLDLFGLIDSRTPREQMYRALNDKIAFRADEWESQYSHK